MFMNANKTSNINYITFRILWLLRAIKYQFNLGTCKSLRKRSLFNDILLVLQRVTST